MKTHRKTPTRKKQPRWIKFEATATSKCPVDQATMIKCKTRDKKTTHNVACPAGTWAWYECGLLTIVAYRIIKPAPKKRKMNLFAPPPVKPLKSHAARPLGASGDDSRVQHSEATLTETSPKPYIPLLSYEGGKAEGLYTGCIQGVGYLLLIELVLFMVAAAVKGGL